MFSAANCRVTGELTVSPSVILEKKTRAPLGEGVRGISRTTGVLTSAAAVSDCACCGASEPPPQAVRPKALTDRAKKEGIDADVFGPMAFDNSVSEKAAQIKGINNAVAGKTDILLVPNVEAGNGLVKMMIYFMGACAAGVVVGGKVPVVITSRADSAPARLASIAAAIVAL